MPNCSRSYAIEEDFADICVILIYNWCFHWTLALLSNRQVANVMANGYVIPTFTYKAFIQKTQPRILRCYGLNNVYTVFEYI